MRKRSAAIAQCNVHVCKVRSLAKNLLGYGAANYSKMAKSSQQSERLGDHETRLS
jgi:hypothetical protein